MQVAILKLRRIARTITGKYRNSCPWLLIPLRVIRLSACVWLWPQHWAGVTCHLALSPFSYNIVDFAISTTIFYPEPTSHTTSLLHGCWLSVILPQEKYRRVLRR